MRIWHESLISKLCQRHLCAMWFEGLGAYKIITEDKKGYRSHPAVKEFEKCSQCLFYRLWEVREEMLRRSYHPKSLGVSPHKLMYSDYIHHKPWQTLEQQIAVLKGKNCECKLESIGGE